MTAPARASVGLILLAAAVTALVAPLGNERIDRDASRLAHPIDAPFLIFRTLTPPAAHGRVATLRLGQPESARQVTGLTCLRVHYAGGRGLCIVPESQDEVARHAAYLFDRTLALGRRVSFAGMPTRARVSPDGRRGVITTYFEEETEAGERLAIDSLVVDMTSGRIIADLRRFRIDTGGLPPPVPPLDIGSVSFDRDGDRFVAAVLTPAERYVALGSIDGRRMTLVRRGVAAESISPDGRRLVVKRAGSNGFWQLEVVDLEGGPGRILPQGARSVDDQVDWLDDAHVMYHDSDESGTSLWVLPIDGVSGPRVLVRDAYSGAIQRE